MCNLLRATVTTQRDDATDSLVLESVLVAAESIITYRRRYRSRAQIETVLDLLLLDSGNPRSLAFQVDRLLAATEGIPGGRHEDRSQLDALLAELSNSVHLADTNSLAAVDDTGSLASLHATLGVWADVLSRIADQLDALHFSHQLPQRAVASARHPSAGRGVASVVA